MIAAGMDAEMERIRSRGADREAILWYLLGALRNTATPKILACITRAVDYGSTIAENERRYEREHR